MISSSTNISPNLLAYVVAMLKANVKLWMFYLWLIKTYQTFLNTHCLTVLVSVLGPDVALIS